MARREEAVQCYKRAVAIDPNRAGTYNDLGSACRELGRVDEAERYYRQALKIQPRMAAAHNNLAILLKERRRYDDALLHARQALELKPGFTEGHNTLALIHYERGELETAEAHFREALALDPDYAAAHSNITIVLVDLHRFDEAEKHCRIALTLGSGFAAAHANMGMLLHVRGDTQEAIRWYERALELSPKEASARFNRALAFLQLGDYREGWANYDHGFRANQRVARAFGLPDWDGQPLADKGVLVYAEQGVGDEIMFASCMPDLLESAARCAIECDPRLAPLFARSFPHARVHGLKRDADKAWAKDSGDLDYQIAIGSLPRIFRLQESSFPEKNAFLQADSARVEHWRERLSALGSGPYIGISWRGGRRARERSERSMVLEDWGRLLGSVDACFVNLQYGPTADDIAALQADCGVRLHAFPEIDPLRELDDFAALIRALDVVVSVDNSTVHLAGALGVPTVVLLPFVPDWRWQLERPDSPWYQSVRLVRQQVWGEWEPVLQEVASLLRELAGPSTAAPSPDCAEMLERAETQRAAGNAENAESIYREALTHHPDDVRALLGLAESLEALGRDHEALEALEPLAEGDEPSPGVLVTAARVQRRLAHIDSVADLYRAAPALQRRIAPFAPDTDAGKRARRRVGSAIGRSGGEVRYLEGARTRLETAARYCQRAAELAPRWEPALRGVGEALIDLDRGREARGWLERAAALDPRRLQPHLRMGAACLLAGDSDAAERCYSTALALDPDNAEARFHLGAIRLGQGRYAEGWRLYAARKNIPAYAPRQHFPFPEWNGEPIDGQGILVFAEQGVGDEIQFVSCLDDLAERAGLCVVECDPRLAPLLRRSFPSVRVEGRERDEGILWLWSQPQLHVQAPLGDLPGVLRRDAGDFPDHRQYLYADKGARTRWSHRIARQVKGAKIGVSWRGGRTPGDQWRRAIDPQALGRLGASSGAEQAVWVCCQYDSREDERARFAAEGSTLHHWDSPDPLVDLDGFASLVSALDLMITADNSTAHLAAALGVPTWILLPYCCDWRWGREGSTTPWYRSARLFRQSEAGDWSGVLEQVGQALGPQLSLVRRKGRGRRAR